MRIQKISSADIDALVESFAAHNWHKPRVIFENYLKEQEQGIRQVWVARSQEIYGYVTLNWHSQYEPFSNRNIPE